MLSVRLRVACASARAAGVRPLAPAPIPDVAPRARAALRSIDCVTRSIRCVYFHRSQYCTPGRLSHGHRQRCCRGPLSPPEWLSRLPHQGMKGVVAADSQNSRTAHPGPRPTRRVWQDNAAQRTPSHAAIEAAQAQAGALFPDRGRQDRAKSKPGSHATAVASGTLPCHTGRIVMAVGLASTRPTLVCLAAGLRVWDMVRGGHANEFAGDAR